MWSAITIEKIFLEFQLKDPAKKSHKEELCSLCSYLVKNYSQQWQFNLQQISTIRSRKNIIPIMAMFSMFLCGQKLRQKIYI
tara:strand:- start:1860 stop:2105 length:246 start_codon:yes stop_codon:yes gene_type:complete